MNVSFIVSLPYLLTNDIKVYSEDVFHSSFRERLLRMFRDITWPAAFLFVPETSLSSFRLGRFRLRRSGDTLIHSWFKSSTLWSLDFFRIFRIYDDFVFSEDIFSQSHQTMFSCESSRQTKGLSFQGRFKNRQVVNPFPDHFDVMWPDLFGSESLIQSVITSIKTIRKGGFVLQAVIRLESRLSSSHQCLQIFTNFLFPVGFGSVSFSSSAQKKTPLIWAGSPTLWL